MAHTPKTESRCDTKSNAGQGACIDVLDHFREKRFRVDRPIYTFQLLYQKISDGSLQFAEHGQRRFLWSQRQMSQLIESVLMGLPMPEVVLYEEDNGNLSIVDGVQRLSTMKRYIDGEFALSNVTKKLTGRFYSELPEPDMNALISYKFDAVIIRNEGRAISKTTLSCLSERLNTRASYA